MEASSGLVLTRPQKEREEKKSALARVEREERNMKNKEPNSLAAAKATLSECIRKETEKTIFNAKCTASSRMRDAPVSSLDV